MNEDDSKFAKHEILSAYADIGVRALSVQRVDAERAKELYAIADALKVMADGVGQINQEVQA